MKGFHLPIDHPQLKGNLTLLTDHPLLDELLQEIGPLFTKLLPIVIAALLGNNDPTPAPTPTPPAAN